LKTLPPPAPVLLLLPLALLLLALLLPALLLLLPVLAPLLSLLLAPLLALLLSLVLPPLLAVLPLLLALWLLEVVALEAPPGPLLLLDVAPPIPVVVDPAPPCPPCPELVAFEELMLAPTESFESSPPPPAFLAAGVPFELHPTLMPTQALTSAAVK
jgi:hypothetical protein